MRFGVKFFRGAVFDFLLPKFRRIFTQIKQAEDTGNAVRRYIIQEGWVFSKT